MGRTGIDGRNLTEVERGDDRHRRRRVEHVGGDGGGVEDGVVNSHGSQQALQAVPHHRSPRRADALWRCALHDVEEAVDVETERRPIPGDADIMPRIVAERLTAGVRPHHWSIAELRRHLFADSAEPEATILPEQNGTGSQPVEACPNVDGERHRTVEWYANGASRSGGRHRIQSQRNIASIVASGHVEFPLLWSGTDTPD